MEGQLQFTIVVNCRHETYCAAKEAITMIDQKKMIGWLNITGAFSTL